LKNPLQFVAVKKDAERVKPPTTKRGDIIAAGSTMAAAVSGDRATPTMTLTGGRRVTSVRTFVAGALARTGGIALAIGALAGAGLHAERLPMQTYNTSNGLAHDRIRCIVPDSRGFLWFCTPDGLSRFDGSRFVNYGLEQGLPNPSVEEIVEVGPGVYWVATLGGLARLRSGFSPPQDVHGVAPDALAPLSDKPFRSLTAYTLGPSAALNTVLRLHKDRAGRLWIGTEGGLFVLEQPNREPTFRRIDLDSATSPEQVGAVGALAEGSDGSIWMGTPSGLFRRLPDGRVIRDPAVRSGEEVRSLVADRSGRIWIGHDTGISVTVPALAASAGRSPFVYAAPPICGGRLDDVRLPAAAGEACRFGTITPWPIVGRSLSEDSDGRIWIGTSRGLIEFDGVRFRVYSKAHGLPNHTINAVAQDRAGHVWIGADAGGVSKLTRDGFVSFREEDGLRNNYITTISQTATGRLRARGGWPVVNEFDAERSTWLTFAIPGGLEWAPIHEMIEDHTGELWVGTEKGLFRFPAVTSVAALAGTQPKAIYTVADGLPEGHMSPAFEDSRGDIWMTANLGSDRRVVRWQRSTSRFHYYPEADSQQLVRGRLAYVEDRAGDVWLGSNGGLARHRDGRFTSIEITEGAPTARVTALHVDPRGRLWIGTHGAGLLRTDDPEAERPRFTAVPAGDHGLSSPTVWCITDDGAGQVYAGTARGVDRLDPETGRFKHFSVADGLAGSEVIAALRDRSGALWFGTFTGISRFVPQPDVARGPPTVWIAGLRIGGVARQLEHLGQPQITLRNLEPHQNQVQVDYFGLSPAPGEPLRYQYQLDGAGSAWTAPTLERSINYAELAPGSYRFLVRAVDVDGHVSSSPASVSFTILPPVWKRWWFFTAVAVLALTSGYSVHQYRVTRLLEMERLRTRIASDLHDDLGSSLTQISILSEVVRAHLGDPEARIADPLSRIGTLSRESVDSMGDIVWAIDPLRDTPSHLLQRMRRVAHELLSAAGVHLRFDSSGDASPHLNAEVRRHGFLIFKEILNNIVRHAGATTVTVAVIVAPEQLNLMVTDDGRGFDMDAHREGQGLRSMQRRASNLGGSMDVTSAPGTGTRVTLTLPLR
jgi:ligand-binding sensor domain-containing protein/signal transduction histidine kinase